MWPFKKKPEPSQAEQRVIPPVDLSQPVENPLLKAALAALAHAQTEANQQAVWEQVKRANYLVVVNAETMKIEPGAIPGQGTMQAGTQIQLMTCSGPAGEPLLPVFTDWTEIEQFSGDSFPGQRPGTLVMPGPDLWAFVLAGSFAGVVINPSGAPLPLNREMLAALQHES
jgi:hypothetical protein